MVQYIRGSGSSVSGILLLRSKRILRICYGRSVPRWRPRPSPPDLTGLSVRLSSLRNAIYRYTRKY
ncbi:MAG: hypothetical protein SPL41_04960 [Succinivibrionaceae bacterium]|nr:hypothetical protein [Succinivibrionaceae bacterium]MDY6336780.1 hypothetical protein [Succinivibrionaceae bacterium]MDY6375967.1 hypothetical protein [Succinivibrionaceae bacterium]